MKDFLLKPLLLSLLLVFPTTLVAQGTKTVSSPWETGQHIDLNLKFGDTIKVDGWKRPEIQVVAHYSVNGGTQDQIFLLGKQVSDGEIRIMADLDREKATDTRREDCPDHRISYNGDGVYICADISYEVRVPEQASVFVHTINADIDADGISGSFHGKSISGFVDLSWPGRHGADISLKTITGEVYSDMDLNLINHKNRPGPVGYRLKGSIAGGGPELRLESISNNVYLRKN